MEINVQIPNLKSETKRPKRIALIGAMLLLIAAAGVVLLYAVMEPKSGIGVRLFCLRYDIASDKAAFLTTFSRELSPFEGCTIPDGIDTYLVGRFVSTQSDVERAGIANFYVRQQRSGRPGNHLHDMGEQLIGQIFQRLPHYDADQQLAAIATIEGCRRGDSIGKYYFTPLASAIERHSLPLETVIGAYERWWRTPLRWPQKLALDPIEDLPYDWSEL